MLLRKYIGGFRIGFFDTTGVPEAIVEVHDLRSYSQAEVVALSDRRLITSRGVALELGRPLSWIVRYLAFSQVNSEHCRHKIFGGTFVIDGVKPRRRVFWDDEDFSRASQSAYFCLQR